MPESSGIFFSFLNRNLFFDQLFNTDFFPVMPLNGKPLHTLQPFLMRLAFDAFNNHIMLVTGKEGDQRIHQWPTRLFLH